jgi:methylmalonyl-CoA/ethylmalonyl-CoA epimerase
MSVESPHLQGGPAKPVGDIAAELKHDNRMEVLGLEGAIFDHAAHAAPRIQTLMELYQGQLGGRFLYGGANERVGYRAINLGFRGHGKIELMEPLPQSRFFESFFRYHPLGGLHHLTFKVVDIDDGIKRALAAGFELTGTFLERDEWREAFFHPRGASGALVQIVQSAPGYPPVGLGGSVDEVLGALQTAPAIPPAAATGTGDRQIA